MVIKLRSTKSIPSEENESDTPHPIPFRKIIDIHINDVAVQNLFTDITSQIDSPLFRTVRIHPNSTRPELSAHAHWTAAFYSLRLEGSHNQCTLDLAPASEDSVTVSTPARIIHVPESVPAGVNSLPVTIPRSPAVSDATFSALGFSQGKATVEVDIHNQAVRLVAALEES